MKMSSRKKLLEEADKILSNIQKEIYYLKLEEQSTIKNFMGNLITSIFANISKWARTKTQSRLISKMPYLMGIDLINNKNLKINKESLEKLESIINDIINEVKNSPEIKKIVEELELADVELSKARNIKQWIQEPEKKPKTVDDQKKQKEELKNANINYKNAVDVYVSTVRKKVIPLIQKILTGNKYKNFEEMIISSIENGIEGITKKDIEQIKNNYIKELQKRVSDYVDSHEVTHELTWKERQQTDSSVLPISYKDTHIPFFKWKPDRLAGLGKYIGPFV